MFKEIPRRSRQTESVSLNTILHQSFDILMTGFISVDSQPHRKDYNSKKNLGALIDRTTLTIPSLLLYSIRLEGTVKQWII